MRRALIDFDAAFFCKRERGIWARSLATMLEALSLGGLNVVGSAPSELGASSVRLIVEADFRHADVLPEECRREGCLVKPVFVEEQRGDQRITRLAGVEVVSKPHLPLAG